MAMTLPSDELFKKCLLFLYKQVEEGKIPQLKKGMAQDLHRFVSDQLAKKEEEAAIHKMIENSSNADALK
jgi:hypothetical protein